MNTNKKNIVSKSLSKKLNTLASESIRLKNIIDNSKTNVKREYYQKKLRKVSESAARVINALSILNPDKIKEKNDEVK